MFYVETPNAVHRHWCSKWLYACLLNHGTNISLSVRTILLVSVSDNRLLLVSWYRIRYNTRYFTPLIVGYATGQCGTNVMSKEVLI